VDRSPGSDLLNEISVSNLQILLRQPIKLIENQPALGLTEPIPLSQERLVQVFDPEVALLVLVKQLESLLDVRERVFHQLLPQLLRFSLRVEIGLPAVSIGFSSCLREHLRVAELVVHVTGDSLRYFFQLFIVSLKKSFTKL